MKVCILAAGRGTRSYLPSLHKALLPLGDQAVISRILQQFPADSSFVVALGFQAELLQEFLDLAHPELDIAFVTVKNFEDPGSGPGHSLLCCKELLQEPFAFTACDTLITAPLPPFTHNWIGVQDEDDIEKWCSAEVTLAGEVRALHYKKKVDTKKAFAGIAYVKDVQDFWRATEAAQGNTAKEVQVDTGLSALIPKKLIAEPLPWSDTGDAASYEKLLSIYGANHSFLGKQTGFAYRYGDTRIEYFSDGEQAGFTAAPAN